MDQFHKSHNAPVPYPTMHHSEQKCAHFCSEWCIVGYGTGALWDFWISQLTDPNIDWGTPHLHWNMGKEQCIMGSPHQWEFPPFSKAADRQSLIQALWQAINTIASWLRNSLWRPPTHQRLLCNIYSLILTWYVVYFHENELNQLLILKSTLLDC